MKSGPVPQRNAGIAKQAYEKNLQEGRGTQAKKSNDSITVELLRLKEEDILRIESSGQLVHVKKGVKKNFVQTLAVKLVGCSARWIRVI